MRNEALGPQDPHRAYWRARVRRLQARIFLGRVLDFCGPALLGGAAVATCLILLTRLAVLPPAFDNWVAFTPLVAAILVAIGLALWRGGPRASDVRMRLEEALRLHNQLSAAHEGAVPFPPPPDGASGPGSDARAVTWRWSQLLPLPVTSIALMLVALLLPVRPASRVQPGPLQTPPAQERLEEIARQLENARLLEERALQELQSQVEQLTSRNPEEWYTHSGLEAAESLLEQTESGLADLAGNFAAAARALDQAAAAGEGDGSASDISAGLEAALQGLEHGRMPAAGDIRDRLRDAAGRKLDLATARELAEALRRNSDFLSNLTEGRAISRQIAQLGPGSTPGNPGGDGEQPGQGGITRGPGTAPLTIAQNPSEAEPGAEGALQNLDPERAALGDMAGQSVGRHEIDREAAEANVAGGSLAGNGSGGEAAWTQRLTPAERRAVQRTFED